MAKKEGSVAPKERVNIVYKSHVGDAVEDVELPLKLLMLGDYTLKEDDTLVEDRKPINIDKDNFNEVMRKQNLDLTFSIKNRLVDEEDDEIPVTLKFQTISDFKPESIAGQVPEMKKLLELREALTALKGPLGNIPGFRKKIQGILGDESSRRKLMLELGMGVKEREEQIND